MFPLIHSLVELEETSLRSTALFQPRHRWRGRAKGRRAWTDREHGTNAGILTRSWAMLSRIRPRWWCDGQAPQGHYYATSGW